MISYVILFFVLCLFVPISTVLYVWRRVEWKCREKHKRLRALPTGLPTLPILGHIHLFLFAKEGVMTAFIDTLRKSLSINQGSFCFWFGPLPLVFINRSDDIQLILNNSKTLEKSREYDWMKFASGDGLVTAPVKIWKITRRNLNALFHPRNLETLVPSYNTASLELVQKLSTKTGGDFDIFDAMYDLSMRNSYGLIFGSDVEVDLESKGFKHMKAMLHLAVKLFSNRFLKPWLQPESIFRFLYKKDIEGIDQFWSCLSDSAKKVIKKNEEKLKHREVLAETIDEECDDEDENGINNSSIRGYTRVPITLPDVYRVIRQGHPQFTEDHLRYESHNLFSTGTDTTAVTLSSCLLALGRYPDVQAKLYDEIKDVLGETGTVSSEDVKKLTYMDCVLKETLRRFSVVPLLMRRNEEELKLSDFTLPPRTTIAVSIMGLNMNPGVYPDPEKFDPERFTTENSEKRGRYAFIPFSGGPRDCIGKQYGWLSMKITLVHILREFKVSSKVDINKMKFRFEIALVSVDGYHVSLQKRH